MQMRSFNYNQPRHIGRLFTLVFLTFSCTIALAQSITWNGSAGNNDWNDGANWNGGVVPAAGQIARFGFGNPTIDIGNTVAPAQILLAGGVSLTLNADVSVGDGVTDQHVVSFANGSLTISDGATLTMTGVGTKNGFNSGSGGNAFTLTNAGTIVISGANNAMALQNDNNPGIVNNSGTITVDGINGLFLGDMITINNSGHMEYQNPPNALVIGSGPTPTAVFNNLPGGVLSVFGNKMNVNGTFINDGLYRSDFSQIIFAAPSSTVTNNAFYDYTGVRSFASGGGVITDNGVQVNRNLAAIDMGGTCTADIGNVSYSYYAGPNESGFFYGTSDAAGEITFVEADLLANVPNPNPRISTERMANGETYFVAIDNFCGQFSLPIELTRFTGRQVKNQIKLEWTTAREESNNYIAVEKVLTNGTEIELGRVRGTGESATTQYYSLIDDSPSLGANVYQLRQVDFDGTATLSHAIHVNYNAESANWLYPTLLFAGQPITLNLEGFTDERTIDIYDVYGRLIVSQHVSAEQRLRIETPADLAAGTYLAKLRGEQTTPIKIQIQ